MISPEYLPNIITIFRLILIGPIVMTLLMGRYHIALGLFIVAGLTDAIDGYLARTFHWISRFGAMVDPIADKLLIVSSYFTLAFLAIIPIWLLAVVLIRDVVIITGGVCYHFLIGQYHFKPTRISKFNTFLQISLLVSLLFHLAYHVLPKDFLIVFMYVVFFSSLITMINYVWVWGWRAYRHGKEVT